MNDFILFLKGLLIQLLPFAAVRYQVCMYVCVGLVGEAAVQVSQVRCGSSGRRDECANRCESALEIARGRCLVQP